MAGDREMEQHLRRLSQTFVHDLYAIGLTPLSPAWLFQEITPVRHDGASGYAVIAVDRSGPHPPDVGVVDGAEWTDAQLAYRIEILAQPLGVFTQMPPASVRHGWGHDEGSQPTATLAIRRARVVHPDSPVFAEMEWHPSWPEPDYSYGGVKLGRKNDTRLADAGFSLLTEFQRAKPRKQPTPKQAKVDALAEAGLRWLDAKLKAGHFVKVEDCGRPQLGEATRRGTKAINDHMNRVPKVYNPEIHQRMHEMIEAR